MHAGSFSRVVRSADGIGMSRTRSLGGRSRERGVQLVEAVIEGRLKPVMWRTREAATFHRMAFGRRTTYWVGASVVAATVLALLASFALLIQSTERDERRALEDRFETRAGLTASFVGSFIEDLAGRQRAQATRLLAGPNVDQRSFDAVVQSLGFDAAVLLDSDGRLLQVWPPKHELLGQDMTVHYRHLRHAVAGEVSVSQSVPSAADQVSVTAVAVPYDTANGRRVLSGAFSPAATPLGAYLDSVVPIRGGFAYLTDDSGRPFVRGAAAPEDLAPNSIRSDGLSESVIGGQQMTMATASIAGTPWRLVAAVPTADLLAPLDAGGWSPWTLWAALAVLGVFASVLLERLGRTRLRALQAARTDVLTGLANRRGMEEILTRAAAVSSRHGLPLSAMIVDIDRFKSVNDAHGHGVGDRVIQHVARVLADTARGEDVAGRWGGEEFLVVTHADHVGAADAAERLRAAVECNAVDDEVGPVTVSIGVASMPGSDIEALLHSADAAMYRAKQTGRNLVALSPLCAAGAVSARECPEAVVPG